MAPPAVLAQNCLTLSELTITLRRTYTDRSDANTNTALAVGLEDLKRASLELHDLPLSRLTHDSATSCRHALLALTHNFEDTARWCINEWRRHLYRPSSSGVNASQLEDDPSAYNRMIVKQLLHAYVEGLVRLKETLNNHFNSSRVDGQLRSQGDPRVSAVRARIRALNMLHEVFRLGFPRPWTVQQQQAALPDNLPLPITSRTGCYEPHQVSLLQRFEQCYAYALRSTDLQQEERATWHQRSIVYWSAQALDLYDRAMKHFQPDDRTWSHNDQREHAHRFLVAALRVLWLAQRDLDNIDSARANTFLFEASGHSIQNNCDRIYEFLNSSEHLWMSEPLSGFERSALEFQIPKLGSSLPVSQDSSGNSSVSIDSHQQHSAPLAENLQFTSPELPSGSFVQSFGVPLVGGLFSRHNTIELRDHSSRNGEFLMSGGIHDASTDDRSLQSQNNELRSLSHGPLGNSRPPYCTGDVLNSLDMPVSGALPKENEVQITSDGVESLSRTTQISFREGLSTWDREPRFSSQWMTSQTYVFKSASELGISLRLWTDREWSDGQPCTPHESVDILSHTTLVPHSAFEPRGNQRNHALSLERDGTRSGLTFRFAQTPDDEPGLPEELMAFQSALLGSNFEAEYPVVEARLKLADSSEDCLKSVRLQLWTDDHSWKAPCRARQHPRGGEAPARPMTRLERTAHLRDTFDDFEGSRLFFFVNGSIYIILITDQVACERKPRSTKIKLSANKAVRGSLRIQRLPGSNHAPAGIPLDYGGLGFGDMNTFPKYKSVEIEFGGTEHIAAGFESDFIQKRRMWSNRTSAPQQFRKNERTTRIRGSAVIPRGDARRR